MMMIITMTTLMMLMNRGEAVNHPNQKIIVGRPNPQTIAQRRIWLGVRSKGYSMSTEGICEGADVMMHLLFPTAGSTEFCAKFPVVVSCSMAPSPSRTCHSKQLLVFIVAPHIPVLTLRFSKLTHPIHMLPFVLSQFFHAMSHKLTQLACKTSQMADKEVRKMKRDAKAATRKRMAARRKEKYKENMKKHKGATGRRTSSSRQTGILHTLQHWRQVSRPQLHTHDTSRTTRNTEHGTRFPSFVDNIFPTSDPAAASAWLSTRRVVWRSRVGPLPQIALLPSRAATSSASATTTSAKKRVDGPSHCTTLRVAPTHRRSATSNATDLAHPLHWDRLHATPTPTSDKDQPLCKTRPSRTTHIEHQTLQRPAA